MFEGSNPRHDTRHNYTQLNDTEHKQLICDAQHKRNSAYIQHKNAEGHYAECRILFMSMLNVIMLSVVVPQTQQPLAMGKGDTITRNRLDPGILVQTWLGLPVGTLMIWLLGCRTVDTIWLESF